MAGQSGRFLTDANNFSKNCGSRQIKCGAPEGQSGKRCACCGIGAAAKKRAAGKLSVCKIAIGQGDLSVWEFFGREFALREFMVASLLRERS